MFVINLSALRAEPATVLFILVVGARQVGELKKQPKRNPKTIAKNVMADKWANAKSNHKSIKKLRKIIKSRVWDHPGGSRGRLGDQLGPRAAQGSKRAPKSREKGVCFWHQNGDPVQLFVVFFLVFFEVLALQIFHDFGCPRTSFWLPFWLYFESSGPLGKQLKVL